MQTKFVTILALLFLALTIWYTGEGFESMLEKPVPVWDCLTDKECEAALQYWERDR